MNRLTLLEQCLTVLNKKSYIKLILLDKGGGYMLTKKELVQSWGVGYKYMYQEHHTKRNVYMFEYGERTNAQRVQIEKFIKSVEEHDAKLASCKANQTSKPERAYWLAEYLQVRYSTKPEDGQTNVDYMADRCNRIAGATEMKRSWKAKQD